MKPIMMFTTSWCPHCKRALQWMEELKQENPAYRDLDITIIDEEVHPATAKQYNYYYVPTYFVENSKVHEGVPSKEIIQKVFQIASE